MPRFFFHTQNDTDYTDEEGIDLPDMESARTQAALLTAALLKDGASRFWASGPWTLTVTDEDGLVFFTIATHGMEAPVASAVALRG